MKEYEKLTTEEKKVADYEIRKETYCILGYTEDEIKDSEMEIKREEDFILGREVLEDGYWLVEGEDGFPLKIKDYI